MAFLFAPAQTSPAQQNAPLSRIFIASWKTKCCRCCRCSNASRAWARKHACVVAILKATKKKKTIRKFFFLTSSAKAQIGLPKRTDLDFFSLSRSLVLVLSGRRRRVPPPRGERCLSLQKERSSSRVLLYVYICSLFFRSALNIFYSFSWERTDAFFLSTFDEIFQPLFDDFFYSKSAKCLLPHFNLRKNSRAEERTNERQAFANARSQKKGEENVIYILSDSNLD